MMGRLVSARAWLGRHLKPLSLLLLAIGAYLSALNRDQALPWAIAALLTSTLVVGIAWPHWLVSRLTAMRRGPARAEEDETVVFHVELHNHGWLPRFMIELVDRLPFVGAASGLPADDRQTLGVLAYVPGRGRRSFEVAVVCAKRGFYRLGPLSLTSSFPLGLVEAVQNRDKGVRDLTIYPNLFAIVALPLHGAPSQMHRGGYLLPEGAGAAEFSGLREYRRGDSPRHVHWPTTARLNELMVREFEPLASACLYLVLDQAREANVGTGKQSSFEYAVRIAGSVARHACGNHVPTRLVGAGRSRLYLPAGSGEHHFQGMLDALAVVDADGATPYAEVLQDVAADCRNGETAMVFISEPAARQAATLQALALLRLRGAHVIAIVFERDTFQLSDKIGSAAMTALLAGLSDLGAHCLRVRRDDDLLTLFNS